MSKMTAYQYAVKQTELLKNIPEEFREAFGCMAFEDDPSAGYEKMFNVMSSLVTDLKQPIKDFEKRIRKEARNEAIKENW